MSVRRRVVWLATVAVMVLGGGVAKRAGVFLSETERVGMPLEGPWSAAKKWIDVAGTPVAYAEAGDPAAPPLLLLHGCPFSSSIWQRVMPALAVRWHVIAPDLLGLGDTRVRLADDYGLQRQAEMVIGLLDRLGIEHTDIVAADHGGATLQLVMQGAPQRVGRAVLTNSEAYDVWPSEAERPYLEVVVHPLAGPLFKELLASRWVRRKVFSIAVHDPATLDDELLDGFVESHTGTPQRWQRLVRFYRSQLDPVNQRETMNALPALARFPRPVLVLWGEADRNFGPDVAERLAREFPSGRLEWISGTGHLPMVERPAEYALAVERFLSEEQAR